VNKQTPEQLRRHSELMAEHQRLVNKGVVLPCVLMAPGSGGLAMGAVVAAKCLAIDAQAKTGVRMSAREIGEVALGLMAERSPAAR